MGVIIDESGLKLGEYRKENVFHIEVCPQYTKRIRQMGIKTCELVLLKKGKFCFIEAKNTCPNQITAESSEEAKINYNDYVQEITEKMRDSLNLYANILLQRYSQEGLSEQMRDVKDLNIYLVLIVKSADRAWLDPFRDKFRKELSKEMRIWNIQEFFILNEEQARKKHFVL